MFVLSNLLGALAQVVDILLSVLYWLIIIRALLSWVNPDPYNPIVQMLHSITEPVLYPIRRFLPFSFKLGLDISPILAILALVFLKAFFVRTLLDISMRLR